MGLRISDSVKIGGFRVRVSAPLNGRGRPWLSVGTRVGRRGWFSVGGPAGGRKQRGR
jgi:hypothetical protein